MQKVLRYYYVIDMEHTVCLHELQLKFLLLMLNQNRTIWPRRAEKVVITYS